MLAPLANWNGQEMPLDKVMVSVLDRAFLLGDAVYEVLRVYKGQIWKLNEHFQRLARSLNAVKIRGVDLEDLVLRVGATLKHSNIQEGLIYIQITRGVAKRIHHFPQEAVPNELIYIEEFADPYRDCRAQGVAVITYPDIRWSGNDIKATSLLANCMAAQAAVQQGCVEAILVDTEGYITEGSHTSVFGAAGGTVYITPTSSQTLPGITKQQVLNLAKKNSIPVKEQRIKASELLEIDELFLTSTTTEILAIVKVDNYYIGSGVPGPLTKLLQQAFQDSIKEMCSQALLD